MDSSQNAYNEDTSALVERLDCLEKALFRSGQNGLNGFQSWEKGQASQLTASSLVLNYRKRKITDVQNWAQPAAANTKQWSEPVENCVTFLLLSGQVDFQWLHCWWAVTSASESGLKVLLYHLSALKSHCTWEEIKRIFSCDMMAVCVYVGGTADTTCLLL